MVVVRRRSEVWVAGIDSWAALQQRMCEGRSAVTLERSKHRVGVDLVAQTGQITIAIVAAHVVAERGNRAGVIVNVLARIARVEDCISGFDCARLALKAS